MPTSPQPHRSNASIAESFSLLAAGNPGCPAVIDGEAGFVTSRAALAARSDELGALLAAAGVGAGHLVAIQLPNSVDFLAAALATIRAGATVVPIDRDTRAGEAAAIVAHLGVRALVTRDAASAASVARLDGESRIELDEPIPLLKLTSGSTGLPKGILTSERNLVADCRNICTTMGIAPEDLNLGAIPFSHSYGFSNLVTPLLLQGTAIVATNVYLPLSILDLANRHRCTVIPGIPMMFDHLSQLAADDGRFEHARTLISAGAPLRASVSRQFRERFGIDIHSFFGCSECGGIAYDRAGASVERGTVGAAMDGVTLTLESDGRLVVESDAVARGYYLGGDDENSRFEPRRYRTDDLARRTASGEIELTGRAGDFINTAGKKVNPREIEAVILECPGVREAKVYGEAAGARGEVVAAAVVAEEGVSGATIRAHCAARLSSWKVPRIVKLLDKMPIDERGKLKREALRKI
ncbi:MAG: acyl--CoA ligase [Thermoanaerobaculia bacterium]|nr:acyl--CoA ligase [Thermoanaerobaculia bacterium]